jgi:hypothetical protein
MAGSYHFFDRFALLRDGMDKEWSLSVLNTFHEYCDNFVAAGKSTQAPFGY